jgi:hypothetical protein
MGKFSRIEYETDQIKGENSDLTTQTGIYIFKFCNYLRFIYLYH